MQCYSTLNKPWYSINITLEKYILWETKKFMLFALLQWLGYCGGLEPNPQFLWGMPVHESYSKREHGSSYTDFWYFQGRCLATICHTTVGPSRLISASLELMLFYSLYLKI